MKTNKAIDTKRSKNVRTNSDAERVKKAIAYMNKVAHEVKENLKVMYGF